MSEIIRRRTIRPSTRLETSVNYRVSITNITASDILVVHVNHESKSFRKTYRFWGRDILKMKSLSFRVQDEGKRIKIIWASTQPING
jgi:hypothetical protein